MTRTVVIVDDHEIMRVGLRSLLRGHRDFHVVCEASDGLEALRAVEKHKPDILVLDISLPGLSGLEVARETTRLSPATRVLIVSMHTNESYVGQALRNGAAGYVRKNGASTELLEALACIAAGGRYLTPAVSEALVDALLESSEALDFEPLEVLSARERQILQLTAEGYSASEIGERLYISSRTVETHRANLMRKTGLRSVAEIVRFALRHGLVPLL